MIKMLGKTDIGCLRTSNQDFFALSELDKGCSFILVCDGMGGHNGGNVAGEMAVIGIKGILEENFNPTIRVRSIENLLISAIRHTNDTIYSASLKDPYLKGMGTTVVLAFILDSVLYIAHVGDSRAYLLRDNTLVRLTHDHSLVQEMVDRGEITDEEAAVHPYKHVITRVLGVSGEVDVEVKSIPFLVGDIILLCSDGLTNLVNENTIEEILKLELNESLCDKLIIAAKEKGGYDNITAAILYDDSEV